MSFLRHGQIYQPMYLSKRPEAKPSSGSASTPIGSMSLQLAIPWQVALLQWGTRPVVWTVRKGTVVYPEIVSAVGS